MEDELLIGIYSSSHPEPEPLPEPVDGLGKWFESVEIEERPTYSRAGAELIKTIEDADFFEQIFGDTPTPAVLETVEPSDELTKTLVGPVVAVRPKPVSRHRKPLERMVQRAGLSLTKYPEATERLLVSMERFVENSVRQELRK